MSRNTRVKASGIRHLRGRRAAVCGRLAAVGRGQTNVGCLPPATSADCRPQTAAPIIFPVRAPRLIGVSVLLASVLAGGACATGRTAGGVPAPFPGAVVRATGAPAPRASAVVATVVETALAQRGAPYRLGGSEPQKGFDCSGLVGYVYRDVAGILLPRSAEQISQIDAPEIDRERLGSGDLVFFRTHGRSTTHVGIFVGEGRFVHAPNEGGTVRLDRLDDKYWRDHFNGAKRIPL